MISANEDVKKSIDLHADAYLVKPFSLSDIIAKTKELIG
jgi:DNA-binding response OmpR family regulator